MFDKILFIVEHIEVVHAVVMNESVLVALVRYLVEPIDNRLNVQK
jgi:hypothetical protein